MKRMPALIGFGLTTMLVTAALADAVPTRQESLLLHVTATVEAIDQTTREVTLKGPLGNSVTFTAGPEVKRLNEVKVGDTVTANYYLSVAAELREPTAAELEKPLTILEGAGRATEGAPAAGGGRRIKAVTTIEGVDRAASTVTVRGPRGRLVTARVENPAMLEKLQIGKTIVITYTEAIAISLEKASSKTKE